MVPCPCVFPILRNAANANFQQHRPCQDNISRPFSRRPLIAAQRPTDACPIQLSIAAALVFHISAPHFVQKTCCQATPPQTRPHNLPHPSPTTARQRTEKGADHLKNRSKPIFSQKSRSTILAVANHWTDVGGACGSITPRFARRINRRKVVPRCLFFQGENKLHRNGRDSQQFVGTKRNQSRSRNY